MAGARRMGSFKVNFAHWCAAPRPISPTPRPAPTQHPHRHRDDWHNPKSPTSLHSHRRVPVYVAATPDQTNAEGALHDALEWGHIRDPGTEIFYLSPMMRRYVATLFSRLPKVPAGSAWYEGRSYRLIRVHRSIYEDASTAHPNRFPLLPIDGEIDMADANDRATWDLELLGYEGRTRFADYTTVDVERRLTMSKAAARRPYASATSALG